MKPYGLPLYALCKYPDLHYIDKFGLKASKGNLRSIGGDIHSLQRSSNKQRTRRYWKRCQRNQFKKDILDRLEE
jgi:hypothetical protein